GRGAGSLTNPRLKGDGGSVRASLARKLVHAKLFGRGSGGTAGAGASLVLTASFSGQPNASLGTVLGRRDTALAAMALLIED
ncbi:MAG: hypothetical protein RL230_2497, partial [Pseudomonadota bacterium]